MSTVKKKAPASGASKRSTSVKTIAAKAPAKSNGKAKTSGTTAALYEALHEHFGFDAFKGTQEQAILNLQSGRDTFVIMPTGGGKSLCYQLPAMMAEGVAIIVSPLIALMKNQVDLVRSYSSKDDVAHFLNSTLTKKEIKEVHDDLKSGRTKMLYVAPETLTKEENIEFFSSLYNFGQFIHALSCVNSQPIPMYTAGQDYSNTTGIVYSKLLSTMLEEILEENPEAVTDALRLEF